MKRDKNYFDIFNSWDLLDDDVVKDIREGLADCNSMEPDEVPEERISEDFWRSLDDEKRNLDIETGGVIIALSNLGFWYGRRLGRKTIGTNVNNIFDFHDYDDYEWYGDKYNIRATLYHHDGRHHVLFRYVDSEEVAEKVCEKIYDGRIKTEKEFMKATKSIRPFIAKTYGWKEFGRQAA